eukprot:gene4367-5980_t
MIEKTYQPADIEARMASAWEQAGAFKAGRADRRDAVPYTIVIPPPNVTGSLHMGHALNNTLQDVLCRFERMRGRDVLWQPGTDHAGIATQMVVERQLMERKEPGRRDMGREKFLERVWQWKAESGGVIVNQLKRLGASCDWSRERFTMDPVKKAFYEYHACLMEPWDGPASISFTDGKTIGATLDRNGLRPSRYCVTTDDRVIMASETGALPVDPSIIKEKGRLQPGKMFVVDMEQGRIISDEEMKQSICSQKPYADWLNKYKIRLEELPEPRVLFTHLEHDQIFKYQKAFGYSTEDLETIIAPMAVDGKEPIGSMGTDVPLAILSDQPQHLSSYFKQLF